MKKKKTSVISTIALLVALLIGLSLLLYPTVSDYWNSITQSKAVASYAQSVTTIDDTKYEALWDDAVAYNERLAKLPNNAALPKNWSEEYARMLAVDDSGIMGCVEIPSINVSLPIYHGTSNEVLQVAIGHLNWTSLPTGGEGTHCVISGHRGLPSAKLFTHLDQLKEGDVFMLRVLDTVLTYEVDQVRVVEPRDTQALYAEEGKDYCTLMTCTPYGVNSHRLLVRGHRVENIEEAKTVRVTADAITIEPLIVAPIVAVPLLLILLCGLLLPKRHRKGVETDEE